MPYPRQLELDTDTETSLVSWIEQEIVNHLSERGELVEKLIRYQEDYLAEPSTEHGTFPFVGSSTIIIPLTAIVLEAVHARSMQTIYALQQRLHVSIRNPEDKAIENEVRIYLEEELFDSMNFREATEPAILELEKLGTGILETSYVDERKKGIRQKFNGTDYEEEEFEVIVKQGPCIESVPLANFMMPFDCSDPQTARWVGKVFWLTPYEIKVREQSGYFKEGTYKDLSAFTQNAHNSDLDDAGKYNDKIDELTFTDPMWDKSIEFYWIASQFNVDGVDDKEIFFVYQRDIQKIVAIWYNWFHDLRRPFRHGVYFPVEFKWYGIGIGKQIEQFQMEITTQHRTRLDASLIANSKMWKVNRNSGIKDGEPIFNGKFWFVDDPNDIVPMEMGDVSASAYNNSNEAMVMSQQRSGINDLSLGMSAAGTPGTAMESMARVQEGNRKFDYSQRNTLNLLNLGVEDIICNIVQWKPNIKRLQFNPKAQEIEAFFNSDFDLFRERIIMKVQLAGSNQNKLRDRQDATQLTGIIQQYYTATLQLTQQLNNPEFARKAVMKSIEGANEIMKQILETFDVRDLDKFLITLPQDVQQPSTPPAISSQGTQNSPSGINAGGTNFVSNNITAPNLASVLPPGLNLG